MTIDQATGYLYFVFYDRRNYSNTQTDVFMARSTDDGETFNNFKVSATPFTPNSSSFFGDYSNVTAHNGKVRPIWTRLDNSTLSLYTAIVDFVTEVTPVSSVSPMSFKLYDNYPNPFNPSTKIKFDVISTNGYQSKINLTVYDSNGREVQNLINGYPNEGTYETEWKANNFATGEYLVKLVSDNRPSK
ncbi:MAG: T9SS type A sorting domain-containing protein [Ignavibacteria bacterium]|nr:T9SS type A sorting domain-containing protein [Ignavibacteria bacterium]